VPSAAYTGNGTVEVLASEPVPPPSGHVQVRVAFVGLCGTDLHVVHGAMDARVTMPDGIERQTVAAYVQARSRAGAFDRDAFDLAYATMAAQRNSKILGIFVRLEKRDGKPYYLKHLPRIRDYLRRALAHPALSGLRDFYVANGLLEERTP